MEGQTMTAPYAAQPTAKPRRRLLALVIALGVLLAGGAVTAGVLATRDKPASPAAATSAWDREQAAKSGYVPNDGCGGGICNPTASPNAEPIADELTAADVKLTAKITRQKCFGSAGCNITYTIQAAYPSELVADGESYEVTYEVPGVEDGPAVNTLTILSGTQFEADTEEHAQTAKHVKSLKVKVTDVEALSS